MAITNDQVKSLRKSRIIAIVRDIPQDLLDDTAAALRDGGIRWIEVTMNTAGALEAIARWRQQFPDVYIGAGTVLNLRQAKEAVAAGASFLISPNVEPAVIQYAVSRQVEIWPGAMTPTEVVAAFQLGASAVKLFPAVTLGPRYVKELQGPLPHIPLIATGGIDMDNLQSFLSAGAIALGIGGKLIDKKLIQTRQFDKISQMAEQFVRRAMDWSEDV